MIDLLWMIPLMLVLMALKAFFSGSEIALVSADKIRLRHRAAKGDRGAAEVIRMEQNPELHLATTLVGTNLAIVSLTTLGTILMIRAFGDDGELLAILVFSPLFLLLTEVVPKSAFQQDADRLAPRVIWPLRVFMVLLFPVVYSFATVARLAARLTGGRATHHAFMTRKMLRAVLDSGEKTSDVTPLTWGRLKQAVKFGDVTAAEVMIPMAEVTTIGDQARTRDAVTLACQRGHFRLPVYRGTSSSVVGVLAMDLWRLMTPGFTEQPLEGLITPALFVAPQRPVFELLPLLRQRDDRMAVVVDEFGSAIGMITLEDIQETVLGEFVGVGYNIPGYVHRESHDYQKLAEDTYLLDGRFGLAEVNELLGIELPSKEAHTIGGFLTAQLRHLPRAGESVTARGFRFSVVEANDRVVRSVRVEPL